MDTGLTLKQKAVLVAISDLTREKGLSPTLNEIRDKLGYRRVSSIQHHLDALKKKGYLSHTPNQSRSLQFSSPNDTISIPLIGNIAAGTPILAIENIEAYIPYDQKKIKTGLSNYFFLRAVGTSMNMADVNGRNIENGDYVLIRKQNTANYGQIVAALIGEEATIKKLSKGNGHIILEPISSDSTNKPIYVFDEFLIQGLVIDVIKAGDKNGS
jgi:repressor LexA